MLVLTPSVTPPIFVSEKWTTARPRRRGNFSVSASEFPSFLPPAVENIKDPFARKLASRIERVPVHGSFSEDSIMSSCVKPKVQADTCPLVLLHGFDSSCLEWRYTLPLLEEEGFETWAVDILGWGFSDLEKRPSCNVASKRDHLYQMWKTYIKRPMTLVGPSLGAAVAIDLALNYPETVDKLILIDASVYAEGTGNLATLPKIMAYAGVYLLKSIPLRLYATSLVFTGISWNTLSEWTNIGRLHCLLPWWEDVLVDFMISGGYNVSAQIELLYTLHIIRAVKCRIERLQNALGQSGFLPRVTLTYEVKQKTLIIWGENDQIIDQKLAFRLHSELPNAILRQIPDCGHIPHVERPAAVAKLVTEFVRADKGVYPVLR